ncbi:MAG: GNAT family N-acetyltransferase [Campylobacteraceae bacterium]|jgi:ribosomal protein S18 acetylase RimI-like enzyme|nr:GNAT family N-acetyltransferase [Campylobacteraceae bacterium]
MLIIRKATPKDAEAVASYLLLAMEDIVYKFIGEKQSEKAKEFMLYFAKKENNQYSYQNCWVALHEGEVVCAVNVYDGARLEGLREDVKAYIKEKFGKEFNPENESEAGEWYIDTLGVDERFQGRGIGSEVLRFLIDKYVHKEGQTLGLLVDDDNPKAKKLYLKLGFKSVGKKTLVGKNMEHLQIKI